MVQLSLDNVSKDFGQFRAVDNISFKVKEGEILTLLGPSGCGKSTTLRMIAGFLYPDEGRIFFGDEDITDLNPQYRNTAMVFQNYALWPHMSVKKNVEFGLNIRHTPREEKNRRVIEALEKVKMEQWQDSMPTKLSGGQQQRIAVARALVVNPDVLLLDEPLSNLDAKLRVETRQEIRDLVKDLSLTTIYVTHDQSEALSISDRIAVLDSGKLRQIGSPEDIWTTPESAFVGSFIGEANTIEMQVSQIKNDSVILNPPTPEHDTTSYELISTYYKGITEIGEKVRVVIRPENVHLHLTYEENKNMFPAEVRVIMFFGSHTLIVATAGGVDINIHLPPEEINIKREQKVFLEIRPNELRSFGPKNY
ncbi:MAG: ABC transporter ATP-binding protein [Candidatus Thorarchaeota archaeon]